MISAHANPSAVRCARDAYGFPVTRPDRLPLCTCPVPCQKRFICEAGGHVGDRFTPWCNGGDDYADAELAREAVVERCDVCWCVWDHERRGPAA